MARTRRRPVLRRAKQRLLQTARALLDEIDSIPLLALVKLLRVLQEGEYERVGGKRTLMADVRIIAASNRDRELENLLERAFSEPTRSLRLTFVDATLREVSRPRARAKRAGGRCNQEILRGWCRR